MISSGGSRGLPGGHGLGPTVSPHVLAEVWFSPASRNAPYGPFIFSLFLRGRIDKQAPGQGRRTGSGIGTPRVGRVFDWFRCVLLLSFRYVTVADMLAEGNARKGDGGRFKGEI